MTTGELHSDRDLVLSLTPRRWAPAVFGVVPAGAKRRRPGDVVRVVAAVVLIAITATAAHTLARREQRLFDLLSGLPSWTRSGAQACYHLATVGVVIALLVALLVSRRVAYALVAATAGALGAAASIALRAVVDSNAVRAAAGAPVAIDVIGRDAADARLFAKVWRSIWYKDSGPTIALTRPQQLEHRAYLLLLADRAGVPVSEVVIAGVGGSRELAVLVLREPAGRPLTDLPPIEITDAVLDGAWRTLGMLTEARI